MSSHEMDFPRKKKSYADQVERFANTPSDLNFVNIPVPGPQGPKGDPGRQGDSGPR